MNSRHFENCLFQNVLTENSKRIHKPAVDYRVIHVTFSTFQRRTRILKYAEIRFSRECLMSIRRKYSEEFKREGCPNS